jgi:hypothetical protein
MNDLLYCDITRKTSEKILSECILSSEVDLTSGTGGYTSNQSISSMLETLDKGVQSHYSNFTKVKSLRSSVSR